MLIVFHWKLCDISLHFNLFLSVMRHTWLIHKCILFESVYNLIELKQWKMFFKTSFLRGGSLLYMFLDLFQLYCSLIAMEHIHIGFGFKLFCFIQWDYFICVGCYTVCLYIYWTIFCLCFPCQDVQIYCEATLFAL